jgi:hypothetical protein
VLASHDLADPADAGAATGIIQSILADLAVPRLVAQLLHQALPALAGDGTPRILDGAWVTVDGTLGTVELG